MARIDTTERAAELRKALAMVLVIVSEETGCEGAPADARRVRAGTPEEVEALDVGLRIIGAAARTCLQVAGTPLDAEAEEVGR